MTLADDDPASQFERAMGAVNDNERMVRLGRYLNCAVCIEIGDIPFHITIERGRVVQCVRGRFPMRSWEFAIRGNRPAWSQFFMPFPEPEFHDIFPLMKKGEFRIEGNLHKLMANLFYFKELLASARPRAGRL